jgi:hypothetical protein
MVSSLLSLFTYPLYLLAWKEIQVLSPKGDKGYSLISKTIIPLFNFKKAAGGAKCIIL